jgi:hypothetical protein
VHRHHYSSVLMISSVQDISFVTEINIIFETPREPIIKSSLGLIQPSEERWSLQLRKIVSNLQKSFFFQFASSAAQRFRKHYVPFMFQPLG